MLIREFGVPKVHPEREADNKYLKYCNCIVTSESPVTLIPSLITDTLYL